MRHSLRLLMILCLTMAFAVLGACNDDDSVEVVDEPAGAVELSPEELGELGARIEADPDRLEEHLAEHGLTLDSYEAAIREITEDPGEAQRYSEAYENARS